MNEIIACPWPQNPLRKLPVEIIKENLRLAVNSEAPLPFSHLGTEMPVPARCRLCPFLCEGECSYPHSPALPADRTPQLAAWAVGVGEGPEAAAEAALGELEVRLRGAVPTYVVMIVACSCAVALAEANAAWLNAANRLPETVRFSYALEQLPTKEHSGGIVFLCAWTAG